MLSSKLAVAPPGGDAEVAGSVEAQAICPQSAGCWEYGGSRLNTGQVFPVSIPYLSCLLTVKQADTTFQH